MGVWGIIINSTKRLLIDRLGEKSVIVMNTDTLGISHKMLISVEKPCVKCNESLYNRTVKLIKTPCNRIAVVIFVVRSINIAINRSVICNACWTALVISLNALDRVKLVTVTVLVMIELCITCTEVRNLIIVWISGGINDNVSHTEGNSRSDHAVARVGNRYITCNITRIAWWNRDTCRIIIKLILTSCRPVINKGIIRSLGRREVVFVQCLSVAARNGIVILILRTSDKRYKRSCHKRICRCTEELRLSVTARILHSTSDKWPWMVLGRVTTRSNISLRGRSAGLIKKRNINARIHKGKMVCSVNLVTENPLNVICSSSCRTCKRTLARIKRNGNRSACTACNRAERGWSCRIISNLILRNSNIVNFKRSRKINIVFAVLVIDSVDADGNLCCALVVKFKSRCCVIRAYRLAGHRIIVAEILKRTAAGLEISNLGRIHKLAREWTLHLVVFCYGDHRIWYHGTDIEEAEGRQKHSKTQDYAQCAPSESGEFFHHSITSHTAANLLKCNIFQGLILLKPSQKVYFATFAENFSIHNYSVSTRFIILHLFSINCI